MQNDYVSKSISQSRSSAHWQMELREVALNKIFLEYPIDNLNHATYSKCNGIVICNEANHSTIKH